MEIKLIKLIELIEKLEEEALLKWEVYGKRGDNPPSRKEVIEDFLNNLTDFIAQGYSLGVNPLPLLRKRYGVPVEWHPNYLPHPRVDWEEVDTLGEGIHVFNPSWDSTWGDSFCGGYIYSAEVGCLLKIGSEVFTSGPIPVDDVVTIDWDYEDEE